MSTSRPASRAGLAAALGLGVAVTGLSAAALPAQADTGGTGLVISEAYGGGGNSGASYKNDFVELYNPTAKAISVEGWSVQYRSATGTGAGQVTPLSGSVPAGAHYLVQEAAGSGGTTDLPTPNATGSIAMAGGGFQVWLSDGTTALTPPAGDVPAGTSGVVDFLGAGGAGSFETAKSAAPSNTASVARSASGADTDNNSADFTAGAPTPEASDTPPPPPPSTVDATIAEIQGTGTASPFAGDTTTYVRTRGVVTAAYPSGGFYGFVIQTPGTGGESDPTPGASDGLFVYQKSGGVAAAVGDYVEVTGLVSEFGGLTELSYDPSDNNSSFTKLTEDHPDVTPLVTDLPGPDAEREAHESELLDVSGQQFTVTNNYSTNQYAEIGLAAGDTPLVAPTETTDAQDTAGIAAATAANAARAITLDDGASINFLPYGGGASQDIPLPWLKPSNPVRVSSAATFHQPVVLDYRNNAWKFQPTHQVTDTGSDVVTFSDTRTENAAPQDVGGDLRLATFNVLNFFNTTGVDFVAAGGQCTYYDDRDGNHVTDNTCSPDGPRGAAEDDDLARQRDKIVTAINTMDADIVSLEEIENSVALGESDRDDALSSLVDALNAAAGSTRWAFAPSPDASDLPPLSEQDVIRTAFIYNPSTVDLVGASKVLTGSTAFHNARQPLAQTFKPKDAPASTTFGVIVNHLKSKGSGVDDGTGQGNANPDRIAQAEDLATFADDFTSERGISSLFLTGDFNAYSMEDPIQKLEEKGYTNLESDTPDEWTYNYGGMDGSLDHVFANEAALADVTGVDIWNINADEAVAFEYSRHNYNATDFYAPDQFRASDHDPEVVGIDVPGFPATPPTDPADSSVAATAAPMTYGTDGAVEVTVSSTTPATGTVTVKDSSEVIGTADVDSDGTETVAIPGDALEPGTHTLTVDYSGDADHKASSSTVEVTVAKAEPSVETTVSPGQVSVGDHATATVTVAADGFQPGGSVTFAVDGQEAGQATLTDGSASLEVGPFETAGTHEVTATYAGDAHTETGASTSEVQVSAASKADSEVKVKVTPRKIKAGKTRAKLHIRVTSPDATPTGTVKVEVGGHTYKVALDENGRAKVRLRTFDHAGTEKARISYRGDDTTMSSKTTVTLHVVKKHKKK